MHTVLAQRERAGVERTRELGLRLHAADLLPLGFGLRRRLLRSRSGKTFHRGGGSRGGRRRRNGGRLARPSLHWKSFVLRELPRRGRGLLKLRDLRTRGNFKGPGLRADLPGCRGRRGLLLNFGARRRLALDDVGLGGQGVHASGSRGFVGRAVGEEDADDADGQGRGHAVDVPARPAATGSAGRGGFVAEVGGDVAADAVEQVGRRRRGRVGNVAQLALELAAPIAVQAVHRGFSWRWAAIWRKARARRLRTPTGEIPSSSAISRTGISPQ